jgi:hypothetical protein
LIGIFLGSVEHKGRFRFEDVSVSVRKKKYKLSFLYNQNKLFLGLFAIDTLKFRSMIL